ncbi:hypothetical protein SSX86_029893 [Deinandra increscens subsp. villosa]|uniref:RRM domain-containing protein n=1 Tax=Deinandra increscens subsp. villosa TaxID=3103831 RepID=A0AAP0CBF4_9ASTR
MIGEYRQNPNAGNKPPGNSNSGRPSFNDVEVDQWFFPKRKNRNPPPPRSNQQATHTRISSSSDYQNLQKISSSVFVTNFPAATTSQDLWKVCNQWGNVSDVFISSRLTKSGKHFGFVRFIGVKDIKALVGNLRTIWLGSFHLFADEVRDIQKDRRVQARTKQIAADNHLSKVNVPHNLLNNDVSTVAKSFADILKPMLVPQSAMAPIIPELKRVDISIEDCIEANSKEFLMGKVLDPLCLPNLPMIFAKEGFQDIRFRYIGGRWIGLSFPSTELAVRFEGCNELKKYFSIIQLLSNSFVPDERCVWIEVSGLPIVASTPLVLKKVGELWGEFIFFGNDIEEPLSQGKVCIITKQKSPIDESIEVVIGGITFSVNVKEYDLWAPSLRFVEEESSSDESDGEDSVEEGEPKEENIAKGENVFFDSKPDCMGDDIENLEHSNRDHLSPNVEPTICSSTNQNVGSKVGTHSFKASPSGLESDPSKPPGFEDYLFSASKNIGNQITTSSGDNSQSENSKNVKSSGGSFIQEFSRFIHMGKLIGLDMNGTTGDFEAFVSRMSEKVVDQ